MQDLTQALKSFLLSSPVISGGLAFLITFLSSPLLLRLAPKTGLLDKPEDLARKIHKKNKPIGGPAFVAGFLPIYAIYANDPFPLIYGVLLVFFTGLIDDYLVIQPKVKLLLHFAAGILVVYLTSFPTTKLSFAGASITFTGVFNFAFLVFWLVGGTNAFNFIDGLDGLAAGVSAISCLALAVITLHQPVFLPIIVFLGALFALLIYNFYPAKLFLGDGGSYTVGFVTSYFVITATSHATPFTETWPLFAGLVMLAIPVLDTVLAIGRRLRGTKGIMEADQRHIHHFLYRRLGHRNAVLTIYSFHIALTFLATGFML